jgi:tRNA(fMet)-specific endonuclease VapC
MTEYILDTDTCIYWLKGKEEINEEAADLFGKIKTDLRRSGQMIEDFDILIASITLTYGGILVTNNVNHFKKIGGLNYESWLEQ